MSKKQAAAIEPTAVEEMERRSVREPGQNLLWCPLAEIVKPEMSTKGYYPEGHPSGAVVHFTAGRTAESSLSYGREQGYCFFVIAKDGRILQSFPLDRWGYHAGKSSWGKITGVSPHFVGIEIDCAGKLEFNKKEQCWQSWFGRKVAEPLRRTVAAKDNIEAGTYEKYTPQQEEALIQLLLWLKTNNPEVFSFANVVGHDEVAVPKGRKNDPGGSLSVTMPALREMLSLKYEIMPKRNP